MNSNHVITMFLGAALLVGTTGTGCKKSLEKSELEGKVKEAAKLIKLDLKTVTCPGDLDLSATATVTCDAIDDVGNAGKIVVTPTEKGFKVNAASAVVQAKLAGHASEALTKQVGKKVTVTCPEKTFFAVPGKSWKCDAGVEGLEAKHQVEFTPSEKDIDMKLTAVGSPTVVAEQHEPAGADAPDPQ